MRKERMNELFPEPEPEFDVGDNKEYKVEAIKDSAVHAKEAERHLPGLYYLVSWKGYPEEESTWEPSSAVMHLRKMISAFHKDHPEKLTASSLPLDSAPPMAKPSIKPPVKSSAKRKRGRPIGSTKRAKEWDIGRWGFSFPVLVRLEGFFTNSVRFESLTNSISFGRDAHSASSSNVRMLFIYEQHIATVLAIEEQDIAIMLSIYGRYMATGFLVFLLSFPLG